MKTTKMTAGGSALMHVLTTMTVLLAGSAAVLRPVSDEYVNCFRTASWQEALLAAESGIDLAALQLRSNLTRPGADWPAPWMLDENGAHVMTKTFQHAGEGGTAQEVRVAVDAPASLVDPVNGWQYYRVRSTGTISFAGSRRAGGEKRDLELRKFSLVRDRKTGKPVTQPSVSRTVEAVLRPSSAFPVALLSKGLTSMTSQNVVVDSYDSSDPAKSTNGQYDPAKRQYHGDVATDGTLITAGNAHIYGNVSTNDGTVTGINNITGVIRDDFYQDIPSISAPQWNDYVPAIITGNTVLTGSPVKGQARYKISDLSLSGNSILKLKAASGSAMSYIDLWVSGNVSVSGNASIQLTKNLIATIYITGNMDIGGNGVGNAASEEKYERPANILIYGLAPANGVTQTVKLNGNAELESAIYAPDATVEIVGGGSDGSFSGSVVGSTISMNGVTQVHYDEALAKTGIVTGYRIASWLEDSF